MAAVRAGGLVKRFETTCAVDGVDLVVEPGEVRGLLGPNGAGKTTLLRLLFGFVTADAGEVELLGRPLGPPDAARLDGVDGFVEEPAFYPYLSGRVNLELLAELDLSGQARGRLDEVLEQVGLAGRGGDRVSGYSTGMRQRLGIAGALLRNPRLLLLDEPTSGLDPAGARAIGGPLRGLASDLVRGLGAFVGIRGLARGAGVLWSMGLAADAGVLAGDVFASEDRHGTWKTVLSRSCTRRDLFAGKLLAVATFALGLLALLAVSSLAAGALLVGLHPVVSFSGETLSAGRCLGLVAAAWLLCALPLLAFASLAVLFSVATRNGIVGVLGPALVDLVMQLLALVGTGVWLHLMLASSGFDAWHALFVSHRFYGPLVVGELASLIWIAACLGASWLLLRRRDFAGAPVSRRAGWVVPVRVAVGAAAVIALLSLAANWGPVGVTAPRLKANITPTFNNLTLLQQRELGRAVPAGARLNVVPSCNRRASSPSGPGEWVCTLTVFIPQPGAVPFQQTPVSYDVTVQSNGCYKAQSPPSFVGQQTMRDAAGKRVVNPLFVFYGCFNPL